MSKDNIFIENYFENQLVSYIRIDVIAHSSDGHQTPPETFRKRPGGIHLDKYGPAHELLQVCNFLKLPQLDGFPK